MSGKPTGLNWDAIRAEYQAKATVREINSTVMPKRRGTPENLIPGGVKQYDRKKIADLYASGKTVAEIRQIIGCSKNVVYEAVKEAGLTIRGDRAPGQNRGAPRRDRCHKGHSMDDAIPIPSGGRRCRKCKQEADRLYQRRRHHKIQSTESTEQP